MNSKKTRKALIGTFIGMMALTAASAATAGVAWFTTTRTATVKLPSAQIVSNRGELRVGKFATDPEATNFYDAKEDYTPKMDSVSSANGTDFYNALLDVDGSELGKYEKDATPTIAQVGFSAATQASADTALGVYLDEMTLTLTDSEEATETLNSVAEQAAYELPENAESVESVKLNGAEVGFALGGDKKTVTLNEAPAQAGTNNLVISYHKERHVVADDPIKNSVRIAVFSKNAATTGGEDTVAAEENLKFVWDTTDEGSEHHYGVQAGEKDIMKSEDLYIKSNSQKFVDLEFVPNEKTEQDQNKGVLSVKSEGTRESIKEKFIADGTNQEFALAIPEDIDDKLAISEVAITKVEIDGALQDPSAYTFNTETKKVTFTGLTAGAHVDITYGYKETATYEAADSGEYTYSVNRNRVSLVNEGMKKGDKVTVVYRYDDIVKKEMISGEDTPDLYYAGTDLTDSDGSLDADLTAYGAYIGSTEAGRLDVVVRAWIEGTDTAHSLTGEDYYPDGEEAKDSIDITGHNYELSMLVSLEAIDVKAI